MWCCRPAAPGLGAKRIARFDRTASVLRKSLLLPMLADAPSGIFPDMKRSTFLTRSEYYYLGARGVPTPTSMERRMKIVRIAGLAIALCAASASLAAAQGRPDSAPPGGRRGGMGQMLLNGITLTDAQQAQLKTIREKHMPAISAYRDSLRSTGAPPDDAARAKMAAMNDAYVAEVRAILTADQQAILDKNIADAKARMRAGPPPSGN